MKYSKEDRAFARQFIEDPKWLRPTYEQAAQRWGLSHAGVAKRIISISRSEYEERI